MGLAIGAFLVLVLLAVAWINGGDKPLHWIEEPVTLPKAGSTGAAA